MLLIIQYYICDFGFNTLFAATVFFSFKSYYMARSTIILFMAADFISTFCVNLALTLNVCLCLDLILMVRDPFKKKEGRVPLYVASSVVFSGACAVAMCFYGGSSAVALKTSAYLVFGMIILYVLMFFASIFYPYRKLSGPSFSKQVRHLVLKRHVLTSLAFMVTNTYVYITVVMFTFMTEEEITNYTRTNTVWAYILKFLFAGQGFAVPILRLSEPYFWQVFS